MFKRILIMIVIFAVITIVALAHTPLLLVEDNGDGTLYAEAGYSDGSGASGMACRLEDVEGNVLWEGKFDDFSSVELEIPKIEKYFVVFDGGPGHIVKKEGPVLQNEDKSVESDNSTTVSETTPSDIGNDTHVVSKQINEQPVVNESSNVNLAQVTTSQNVTAPVVSPINQSYYPQSSYGWLAEKAYANNDSKESRIDSTLLILIVVFLGLIACFLFLIFIMMLIQICISGRTYEKKN